MGLPRQVIPQSTYLITRRCAQRTFRLLPHPLTNAIIEYAVAAAAERHGFLIHACSFLSNHHHLVVTDTRGLLPDFLRDLHRSIAKALNASQGQSENLWAAEQTSVVLLLRDDDIIAKIAYVVNNPVEAGLVSSGDQWPGVIHWKAGFEKQVTRPLSYFRQGSPDRVTLKISPVPQRSLDAATFEHRIDEAIEKRRRQCVTEVLADGLPFIGAQGIYGSSFLHKATKYEEKRRINPRFAARDPLIRAAMIQTWRAFQHLYRSALELWQAGVRAVEFPPGTWWMRVHHGANVRAAPFAQAA